MATFRAAQDDEDEVLGRVIYNAFRLNWGTNWELNVSEPLPEIPATPSASEPSSSAVTTRMRFHRTLFPLVRNIGGRTDVALAPGTDTPVAVCCFLPPKVRPGAYALFMSGWLSALLAQGLTTTYRFQRGYLLGEKQWHRLGEPIEDGAYVLILGTDPTHAGHGYAGKLLKHSLQQHQKTHPGVPVYLETATDDAQRVYERLGFKEMCREQEGLPGVDEQGCKLRPGEEDKKPYFALRCMKQDGTK